MQHNTKFARMILKRLSTNALVSDKDLPHMVYYAHLSTIDHFLAPATPQTDKTTSNPTLSENHVPAALAALSKLHDLATANQHHQVVFLAKVIRLRVLVGAGLWEGVQNALALVEEALPSGLGLQNVAFETEGSSQPLVAGQPQQSQPPVPPAPAVEIPTNPVDIYLSIHALIIGVVFYTHLGDEAQTTKRLTVLHTMLDGGALKRVGMANGLLEVCYLMLF